MIKNKSAGFTAAPNVVAHYKAGEIIDDQQLDHQRRAANNPHAKAAEVLQGLKARKRTEGDHKAQRKSTQKRNEK